MVSALCTELASGITCIDAGYLKPQIACFYLVKRGQEYALLETGTSRSLATLMHLMADRGIAREQVRYVVPTHVHLDHAGGAGAMMSIFPHAQLLVHPRGARHMIEPAKLIAAATEIYGAALFEKLYGEVLPVPRARVTNMQDGDTVDLGGGQLEFRHTRGHADHHLCVWDEISQGWFVGDMFGVSYPWCRFSTGDFVLPSTTPSQFNPEAFYVSLNLLDSYAPQRLYLTHFGEIAYARDKKALLEQQLQAYCQFALSVDGGEQALQRTLSNYTQGLLRQFSDDHAATWEDAIAFDMQLNAQGLQSWLRHMTDR